PVTDWASDFDHLDPAWVDNPYPIWDELRQKCPIAHTDRFMGVYFLSRYEDVRAVADDTEHFSSRRGVAIREGRPQVRPAPPLPRTRLPTAPKRNCCCRRLRLTRSDVTSRKPGQSAANCSNASPAAAAPTAPSTTHRRSRLALL